jgi:predicted nucleic acid-binding Zn ribbon protein
MSNKLIKCKSCGKEISTEAKTCPQCGAPNKKKLGCLSILVLAVVALFIIGIIVSAAGGGHHSSGGSSTVATSTPTAITKDQWKEKVSAENGTERNAINSGSIAIMSSHLFQMVGQPANSRANGDNTYLSWECSDGTIELKISTTLYRNMGMVSGDLRER